MSATLRASVLEGLVKMLVSQHHLATHSGHSDWMVCTHEPCDAVLIIMRSLEVARHPIRIANPLDGTITALDAPLVANVVLTNPGPTRTEWQLEDGRIVPLEPDAQGALIPQWDRVMMSGHPPTAGLPRQRRRTRASNNDDEARMATTTTNPISQ